MPTKSSPPKPQDAVTSRSISGRHQAIPSREPLAARTAAARGGELVVNLASSLADVIDDFRRADRFFRYKALVIGLWVFSFVVTLAVAYPGESASNDANARLVIAGDADRPVYMITNEGKAPWTDVRITVNGTYQATATTIPPNGYLTLSGAVLFDKGGQRAPDGMAIRDIVLDVRSPRSSGALLEGGMPSR